MAELVLQQTNTTKHPTPNPSTSSPVLPFPKRQRLEGELHKRVPQRPATVPTDIYVSRKSAFGAQLARAKKLLFPILYKGLLGGSGPNSSPFPPLSPGTMQPRLNYDSWSRGGDREGPEPGAGVAGSDA
ncbi:hypothetical protein BC937DRAFT_90180 [Endogone sp. FLAS-F59071]|nr:hypothetical protein BC937DRAFT_90180 [Endogone sp. FLAS-F59071]|eukprot:RUS17265.1 hypothetical protein BC937DRAFT_90180 [Endogone sp. FLAS-F59071]